MNTKEAFENIPESIRNMYGLSMDKNDIDVHANGLYINIEVNKHYYIVENPSCYTMKNGKVSVSLWKEIKNVHITVF